MALSTRPLRVLVADDEPLIADTLTTIFRNHGFNASSVYSGYSAIETAVNLRPDVVISDIMMPGTNGVDAVLSIARRVPEAQFVLMTGHGDCEDILRRAQLRGLELVCWMKPVRPESFIEYLAGCVQRREKERQPVTAQAVTAEALPA